MMRIDKLSSTPNRAGQYRVSFDDGSIMRLYRQTVEDFGLYAGMELSDEDFQRLHAAAGQMSAKMRAVRIVAATGVSKKDLEQRLIRKGENPTQAKEAVNWMEQLDLIDDRKTAEQVVSSCIRKGYGLARAKQALYEKRIPKDLWEDALSEYPDQQDKILEYLEAKLPDCPDQRQIRRTIDALLRRGHPYTQIRKALDRLSLDTNEFREE